MENENITVDSSQQEVEQAPDVLETLKQLRENQVPKERYEKLKQERDEIFQAYANGEHLEQEQEEQPVDIDELRHSLFYEDNSNLEYVKKALALRDALIAQGQEDPFVPTGTNIAATNEDHMLAEHVATVFEHCVEYANGNSEAFTNELQRLTKNATPWIK